MAAQMAPDKAGDESVKKILDGLYKVAIGIDELRNRYGRDHGREAPLRKRLIPIGGVGVGV